MHRMFWLRTRCTALILAVAPGLQAGALAAGTPADFLHHEYNRDAFTLPAPALSAAELRVFNFGHRIFNTNWVVAPAAASGFDGLGPTFNGVSCSGCHLRAGRGRAPLPDEQAFLSMLVRISVPGQDAHGGPKPVPGYGGQFNDRAIPGVAPEVQIAMSWQELPGTYADGEPYSLRRPTLAFSQLGHGPLPSSLLTSARVAPAVFGLGLLEAIPEADLRVRADPEDRDRDGISGRLNWVYSPSQQRMLLGRFGWKASVATLLDQNALAAQGDIGLSSRVAPEQNCPPEQGACRQTQDGGAPELADSFLEKLNLYVQMLGVPAPRPLSPAGRRGQQLFGEFGCSACHSPEQRTGTEVAVPLLAEQVFAPYTDLLLHDMGAGLADGLSDFAASGSEWRTAPLWGVGLIPVTNEHAFYLHDGRARGLAEAILWHGGEAESAQRRFKAAASADRLALLEFLQSL